MSDDVVQYVNIDSALFGAMAHVAAVIAPVTAADAVVLRVTGAPEGVPALFLQVDRVARSPLDRALFERWALDDNALLGQLDRRRWDGDGSIRPREHFPEHSAEQHRMFALLKPLATVSDAFCMMFKLSEAAAAIVVLMRVAPSDYFQEQTLQEAERLRPGLTRLLRAGLHQDSNRGLTSPSPSGRPRPNAIDLADMLGRLSKTERHVLDLLRSLLTERSIAEQMQRSPHTIHVHVKNIYRKLNISSRRQLLDYFEHSPLPEVSSCPEEAPLLEADGDNRDDRAGEDDHSQS
jgi:DNA-binding NarL/FixJ family response regulator